jgi:predicted AlkP superfamily pyrophosphatase or phosphodiesterase
MTNLKPVILILIDGLRPDGLVKAETPILDRLIAAGAYTLSARTVMPSITLPCHTSLFLGVNPEQHGVTTNLWALPNPPIPDLLDTICSNGGKSASFYNWEELRDISRPGSLHASFFLKNCYDVDGVGDLELAKLATAWLSRNPMDFTFIYLGYTDTAGHDHGWMSERYLKAITNADRCIGLILSALPVESTVIVTSDHGGHDRSHGTDSDDDMIVPFIIRGPDIPAGYTIDQPINIIDIAPTIAVLLGITPSAEWAGIPLEFPHRLAE